jgi:DDE family transposase
LRRGRAEALDLRRRQSQSGLSRLFRPVRDDAGGRKPRVPPQDVRRRAADRLDRLRLAGVGAEWARFSTSVFGAKAHVVYDPDFGRPVYHAVTAANVNDIAAAKAMPIEAGATYVFDLGYYDFGFWAKLDALGCRLVTRFKANTPLNKPREMPLESGSPLLSDRIGFLPARQAMNRKNPMQDAVREIVVRTETGQTLRLFTNDLDAPAQEIADLYKRRWRVELFFRVMKQTLKITRFVGRSENAVRIQIAVALIAFLLLRVFFCAPCNRSPKKPAASSNSFDSCAPTSCTEKTRHGSENRSHFPRSTLASSNSA